jgi:serine/threonine protein kinase
MPEPAVGTVVQSPKRSYKVVKRLSGGAQGAAYLVESGGASYFMKYMSGETPFSDAASGFAFKKRQERLAALLGEVRNFVADVVEFFEWDQHYCRVDTFVSGMRLEERLHNAEADAASYPQSERERDALVLCYTVAQFHEKGIVHRDLKPANVMVQVTPGLTKCVVVDFDGGFIEGEPVPENIFTPGYGAPEQLAPELSRDLGPVGRPSDVFAVGCVLYELLLYDFPWRTDWNPDCLDERGIVPPDQRAKAIGVSYPAEVLEAIRKSLRVRSAERPSAGELHRMLAQAFAPAPQPVVSRLALLSHDGRRIPIPSDVREVLGRTAFAGWPEASTVSGQHVQLAREGARWFLWHLSRTNATILHRGEVESRLTVPGSKVEIRPGDRLKLGDLTCEVTGE